MYTAIVLASLVLVPTPATESDTPTESAAASESPAPDAAATESAEPASETDPPLAPEPKPDIPGTDTPGPDTPGPDTPGPDTPGTDAEGPSGDGDEPGGPVPSASASAVVPRPVGPPLTPTEALDPPRLTQPVHPLTVRWGITGPVIGGSLLGFALLETLGGLRPAPIVCTPPADGSCPDLGPLEPIDRVALGHYDEAAATASDVMVYLAVAGSLAVGLAESIAWAQGESERGVARHRRRGAARFGINTAIWAESVGVAMVTTNVLKDAVGRPRPLAHLGEAELMAQGIDEIDGDFGRSFPSGHATLAFSSAVAGSMLLTLAQCRPTEGRPRRCSPRSRREKVVLGLTWGLSLAVATTTATLRVVAGKHYPTDVLMGSVLGATSGVVIPLLHDRRWR